MAIHQRLLIKLTLLTPIQEIIFIIIYTLPRHNNRQTVFMMIILPIMITFMELTESLVRNGKT